MCSSDLPDEGFDAGPHGNRVYLAVDGGVVLPDLLIVGLEVGQGLPLHLLDPARETGDEASQQAGLREIGDVRWGVGVDFAG